MTKNGRLVLGEVYKVSDVASLITTSSGNDPFPTGPRSSDRRLDTTNLGQLKCSESWPGIVNITKIRRQYSWYACGWHSDKKKGIFPGVDPFKGKNINIRPFI